MQLEFKKPHLSIAAFPTVELPPLAIIVGLNGSGKSHLLQAIANGSVSNSIAPFDPARPWDPNSSPIKLLEQGNPNFNMGNGYVSPMPPPQSPLPMDVAGVFLRFREEALEPFRTQLQELCGCRLDSAPSGTIIWGEGAAKLIETFDLHDLADRVHEIFAQAEAELMRARHPQFGAARFGSPNDYSAITFAQAASIRAGISILAIRPEHLRLFEHWGQFEQFSANLPMIFGRYRDARLRNWMMQKADAANKTHAALSDEEFQNKFGPPPWTLINETLRDFSLPYEVTTPPEYDYGHVSVEFRKLGGQEIVLFQNLSSGEKVLAQFAISSFQYDENFMSVQRPKVLLLDEMDASLHPEMVHRWLGAIQHGLAERQGMHCILTTHSPTTVALAPEEALYRMTDGRSGLTKISKQAALNKLTFGVPTLSIDYSGQRQVFVESDTDAAIYQNVYSLVKSQISCDWGLNFLSTGMRDKDGGEINSGCGIVKNIVKQMILAGNRTVFGVVDWDRSAVSTDRVKVVAEGVRDGIENVLLDPLLICLLLLKGRRPPEGLEDIDRFSGADVLGQPELQRMVDAVQRKIITDADNPKVVEVSYLGGAITNVLDDYLKMDDHKLEEALRAAFPYLRKWSNRGALVTAVINEVLTEYRCFCPSEIPALFETIANAAA